MELHEDVIRWPPGRLAATLVHKFRFDGIVYDRCIDTTAGALPFRIDLQVLGEKNIHKWGKCTKGSVFSG